jgi:ferrous iron transport protein B
MWLMFFSTFYVGAFPQNWIERAVSACATLCIKHVAHPTLGEFLGNGVIRGVGSVLVFLPNIMIMFFFIAAFQVSGLSQRFALLMDKLMHGIGLHGHSFIPLLMGFGCNVPAILGTSVIPRKTDRLVTMLMIPFMSCSARLPVYILLINSFFPDNPLVILMLLYLSGIFLAIITALLINKFIFKPDKESCRLYIDNLSVPKIKPIIKLVWDASSEFVKKIGTVVLIAVVTVWFLDHFPQPCQETEQVQKSYLQGIGELIQPALQPLGFDWQMSVGLLSGLPAKEFIVGTLSLLNPIFNKASALSFLFFSLLYVPCIGAVVSIYKESKSLKWTAFTVGYTISLAWIVAFVVYRIALLYI